MKSPPLIRSVHNVSRYPKLREAVIAVSFAIWIIWMSGNLSGGLIADEAVYMRSGLSMIQGDLYQNPTHMNAPIIKYILGVSQTILGVTPTAGRLVGVTFGAGTLVLIWQIGRELATERTGIVAAILTALTFEFVVIVPTALLEPGMLFFFALTLLALVRWADDDLDPTYLGVALLLLGATKVQAGILVIAVLAVFLATQPAPRDLISLGGGVIAGGLVIYLPYVFIGPPDYYGGGGVPAIAKTLFETPLIGGPAYIWAATFVHNLGHVSTGHSVEFLGETINRAPFWAYPVWMVTRAGAVHLFGLGVGAYLAVAERSRVSLLGGVAVVVFLILTIIPVRLPRYAVVLYPLTAILAAYFVEMRFDIKYAHVFLVILLLPALVAVPLSPAPDSGYDQAADYVENNAPGGAEIVTENPAALTWHLGFTTVKNYDYNITRAHEYSLSGGRNVTISKRGSGCIIIGMATAPAQHKRIFVNRKHHITGRTAKNPLYVYEKDC